ncbi:uncharacterized protein L201_005782 [Kwoniella dendrophila CBS 6074]|uniref:SAC3/GANP/THP3 conserved domain-containing protein n=1 Tax=Kwoniella dendrophila CBS 6074 TaxID=1295534 RepID=A0AAX4K258_9TREE
MPSAISALDSGNPDEDDSSKASKLAARAARFNKVLPGNKYKQLEEMRIKERKAFEDQGLIKVGKTTLGDAVDMRGTCEKMCSEYEREFREYTREVHPFEKMGSEGRMDASKAVAAYSRSDAGAGHGDSAILPSDLRTPQTLVRTLDYLFSVIMPTPPPTTSSSSTPRKALGYSAGFIRDRSRAIRKEFAMQSSWGHEEAIASFERIARWHILCLRELQEESGTNVDLHIDSAELNRCFTSLRQQYNDRREETGLETPCPNESEFTAYMLIYDLNSKSVSIPFSELPAKIIDHPLVKMAWEIRRAAQRNFDSQKEGSKHNAELGMNLITRFVKLLKQPKIPFLLACLVEIRLREMRRSALRALRRPYPPLKSNPIRTNELGEVVERKMILLNTLNKILGCEQQEDQDDYASAWDDIDPINNTSDQESVDISRRFNYDIYQGHHGPVGSLINLGSPYDDNKDAPFTRRWKLITEKRGNASYVDIVNGQAGVQTDGVVTVQSRKTASPSVFTAPTASTAPKPISTSAFSFKPASAPSPAFAFTPSSPAVQPKPSADQKPFFRPLCPPPDHPDVLAAKNKELLPGPPPLFAVGAKGIWAETAPPGYYDDALKRMNDGITNTFRPPAPTSTFSFAPPKAKEAAPAPTPKEKRLGEEELAPPAKAPLFSSPAFFSATAPPTTKSPPAVTSIPGPSILPPPAKTTSPTLPPFSIPKPISPVAASSLTASTSSPSQQRKRVASSVLSTSTSRLSSSVMRKSLADTYRARGERMDNLPEVCDLLIDEVIQSMIEDYLSEDLTRYVKQQKAAEDYQRRKVLRSEAILSWSQSILQQFVDEEAKRISRIALLEELKRRYLTRRSIKHWKSWAKSKRQSREQSEKKHGNMLTFLNNMGLSKSVSSLPTLPRSETSSPISDVDMSLEIERLDSLQIDIEINHAERTKDNFFSPSTFLMAITKHIGQFLSHSAPSSSAFHTVLSIPSHSVETVEEVFGSPPDEDVQRWLNRKFLQPNYEDDNEEAEPYINNGVIYETKIVESGKQLPDWSSIGLYIFEVPLKSNDEVKISQNIADCQDRIGILVKGLHATSNRYVPSLIILTWEEESLEELGERLQISTELETFTRKSLVSLAYSDDLDERFSKSLEIAIPEITVKEQLVIRLNDVITNIYPNWQRYIDISNIQIPQRPKDINLSSDIFKLGIELINLISESIRKQLKSKNLHIQEENEDFDPIILPEFKDEKDDLPFELVERIPNYFEDSSELKGIDDLNLLITPLRQSAFLGQPLPIIPILQSLSYLVLGELKDTSLHLNYFSPSSDFQNGNGNQLKQIKDQFISNVQHSFENKVNQSIKHILPSSTIAKSSNNHTNTTYNNNDRTPSPKKSSNSHNHQGSNPKKRNRLSNENQYDVHISSSNKKDVKVESKASKNAKLLKALRDVEKTLALSQIEGNDVEVM